MRYGEDQEGQRRQAVLSGDFNVGDTVIIWRKPRPKLWQRIPCIEPKPVQAAHRITAVANAEDDSVE